MKHLFLISAFTLGYFLYKSVDDVMQQEKLIIATEARIIEKLQMLRDAQVAYLASNGVYAGNWNDLKKFIEKNAENNDIYDEISYLKKVN